MTQTGIPFLFMRGGTSRGPYFNRADLPDTLDELAKVLVSAVGSGHPLNIDGIGGGAAVTTKVAMLSKSNENWADVDYFFAQVTVDDGLVDFKPTCGNILSGVGPAAIEMGLMEATGDTTEIRIRAVNTGARVIAKVATPDGKVEYQGDARIDGVPGTAAPIELAFMDVAGSSTGAFLPTGAVIDEVEGVEVTCMDVAMPIVIARASDFGVTGYEPIEALDANTDLMRKIESVRTAAGTKMGMGDVAKSVTPKFALLAPAQSGGSIAARYFMPWKCHPTMAVTGGQCLASCALTPGTVADALLDRPKEIPAKVILEHPSGLMEVIIDYDAAELGIEVKSAGILRTARKLVEGAIFVPDHVLAAE